MPIVEKITECVDKEKIIAFLRELIRIPSPSGEEREIAEFIAKKMDEIGLSVEIIGGNVVGKIITTNNGPTLILNGHMDTVPVGERNAWSVDPFGAEVIKGRVYGRGASDMKGGLASMIMSLDLLKRARVELNGNVIVTAVVMEEIGKKLIERKGVIELIDKKILKGDAAIICEPTNLNVSIGHRSRVEIEIITYGRSAHGGMPEKGVNAIEKMAAIILSLKKLKLGYHEILGKGTLNVGVISGGTKSNVIPEFCKIIIDRRLTLGETPEKAKEDIERIIAKLMKKDKDLKADVNCPYAWYPSLIPEDELIIQVLKESVEIITKNKPRIITSRFHTDGGFIHHMLNIPIGIFGPGDEELAHITDEYVEISQVIDATSIYAIAIAEFLHKSSIQK